jgi:hypothetical protein|tara:strand:+ start:305 stop:532 length:228 start_codon:yes stop_codon:yes gene_type:complete
MSIETITPNKFAIIVEDIVRKKRCNYIDAIVIYCTENQIDPSTTKSMINKQLKEKIAYEATNLNLMKEKVAKLPI